VNVAKATQAFDAEGQLIRPDDANALNEFVRALAVPVAAQ
jgi:hypothetical protein